MRKPALTFTTLTLLTALCAPGCDEDRDREVTRQEVKETLSPKADAGLESAKSSVDTLGVQTLDGNEVAQHPNLWHDQTLRSTLRPLDVKDGVARFATDDKEQRTLSLRLPQDQAQRLSELAPSSAQPAAGRPWLSVTYRVDSNVPDNAPTIGEIKDLAPASPPKESGNPNTPAK